MNAMFVRSDYPQAEPHRLFLRDLPALSARYYGRTKSWAKSSCWTQAVPSVARTRSCCRARAPKLAVGLELGSRWARRASSAGYSPCREFRLARGALQDRDRPTLESVAGPGFVPSAHG